MKICKKCVQPDTRPGIKFDKEGVCPPCRFAEKHDRIDWKARRKELEAIAEYGKEHNVSGYDTIIGVSGGKDSTRQAIYLRDELGLNPLLVSVMYPPEHITERGAYNIANLISLGFDCIIVSPDPQVSKKKFREGFLRYGNPAKSTELVLLGSLPRLAIAYHIPLICLGENPAIALGALEVKTVSGEANQIKHMNSLKGGVGATKTADMSDQDLYWYNYPSDKDIEKANLKTFFLGYFIPDFTRFKNGEFAIEHGLKTHDDNPENTGDSLGYEALDDNFTSLNQMLKYIKYGFGRTTDQVCEAVRLGRMNHQEAIETVKKYDGKCAPKYIKKFCNYIGITEEKFWEVADKYRDKDIWKKDKADEWQPNWELK